MAQFTTVYPTIPVTDLARAREFYEGKLGLAVASEVGGGLVFQVTEHVQMFVYQRGPSKADHTLAGFRVDDISKTIDELAAKGVQFEHYDTPDLKTDEKGISDRGGVKAAWFKDPDGNILGITQVM